MRKKILGVLVLMAGVSMAAQEQFVYVGTYTGQKSKGIYTFRFDSASGKLSQVGVGAEVVNPSFLTIAPGGKYLYAVSELGNDGKTQGRVTAYSIDAGSGALTMLNSQLTGGGGACHLVVDRYWRGC